MRLPRARSRRSRAARTAAAPGGAWRGPRLARPGEAARPAGSRRPGSARVSQLLELAPPAAFDRLEDVAIGHVAAVDVNRDGRRVGCVLEDVILERRDERPRLGLARVHDAFLLELDHAGLGIPAVDRV